MQAKNVPMNKITNYKKVFFIIGLLSIVSFSIAGVSIYLIYKNAQKEIYARLTDIVIREKAAIGVWHKHYHASESEVIEHIKLVRKNITPLGKDGEILFARNEDENIEIQVLQNSTKGIFERLKKDINVNSPLYLSLSGKEGIIQSFDYKNIEVFAAYTYIPELKWGIVAKIPVSEINAPYIQSAFLVFALTLILISLSSYVFIFPLFVKIADDESILKETNENLTETLQKLKVSIANAEESETKHQFLFDNTTLGILYQNSAGEINDANKAAERILGLTIDQMQGLTSIDPSWKAIHEDGSDFPGETHPAAVTLKTGKAVNDVIMGVFNPLINNYTWLNINSIPRFKDNDSKPFEVIATFEDITERKLIAQKFRKSENLLRSTLDNMNEGFQIIDREFRYTYVNAVTEKQLGKSKEELLGKIYYEVFPAIKENQIFTLINECMIHNNHKTFVNEFIYPDGRFGCYKINLDSVPEGVLILTEDISEQIKSNQIIFEQQNTLQLAFDIAELGLIRTDFKTNKRIFDKKAYEIFEVDESEVPIEKISQMYHPDDIKVRNEMFSKLNSESKNCKMSFPFRLLMNNGQYKWVSSETYFQFEDGNLNFGISVIKDITERKLAEEALKKSKQLLSETESVGKVGGWEFNLDTLITNWTDEVYRIHEVDFDFFHNVESGINFYAPASKSIIEQAVTRAIEFGEDFDLELEIITAKGTRRDVHVIGKADLEHRRIYGFFQDITERKGIENALRESEEYLKLGYEAANLGIWKNNLDTMEVKFDDRARIHYGFDDYNVNLSDVIARIHPDDMERLKSEIEKATAPAGTDKYATEYRVIHPDGNVRWLYIGVRVIFEGEGENRRSVIGYGTSLDITERKRAEEKISQMNKELEERVKERTNQLEAVNRELESFSYSVSHDLRAPLRSIDGFSSILQKDFAGSLNEQSLDYFSRIRKASQTMGQLIDDMLKLSRVTKAEMKMEKVNLSEIVTTLTNEIKELNPNRKAEFIIQNDIVVSGDKNLLRIALKNLVDNAWKYSSKNESTKIEFGKIIHENITVYLIRDNGVGFNMKYVGKLFGAFQRLHGVAEFEGTGIGLATVNRIITKHGGSIWAEAEINKGASFYFKL